MRSEKGCLFCEPLAAAECKVFVCSECRDSEIKVVHRILSRWNIDQEI